MTEYIKQKEAIDTVVETYYDTPDINLNESKLERLCGVCQPLM